MCSHGGDDYSAVNKRVMTMLILRLIMMLMVMALFYVAEHGGDYGIYDGADEHDGAADCDHFAY